MSNTDWTTFNAKQNALSTATSSVNGILSSADWTTFNNKQATITASSGIIKSGNNITLDTSANNKFSGSNVWNGTSTISGDLYLPNLDDTPSQSYVLFYDNDSKKVYKGSSSGFGSSGSGGSGSGADLLPASNVWTGKQRFSQDVSFNNTTTQITSINANIKSTTTNLTSNTLNISGGIMNIYDVSFNLYNIPSSVNTNVLYYDEFTKAVTYGATPSSAGQTISLINTPLTGIPTAPTATNGTSTTQLATTAFVNNTVTSNILSPNVTMTSFSASGGPYTYTVPTGCVSLWIRTQGGGGGGGGSSASGGNGTPTTISTMGSLILTASGGFGGGTFNGGAGGTSSGGNIINMSGNTGITGSYTTSSPTWEAGGAGGSSTFGLGGAGGTGLNGTGAVGKSGSGGGGGAGNAPSNSAGGGGSGGYSETMIKNPTGTYTINVGAGGIGGTGSGIGGLGGDGMCVIFAYTNGLASLSSFGPSMTTSSFSTSAGGPYTFTAPMNCASLWIRLQGAGGGGGGGSNGMSGGTSTVSGPGVAMTANGGSFAASSSSGKGGSSSGGTIVNLTGKQGAAGTNISISPLWVQGGEGGNSYFGSGGLGGTGSTDASGLSGLYGGGGGGGVGASPNATSGGGGGSGGYCETMINNPNGTYTINLGAGGAGGSALAGQMGKGGNGADGMCLIVAYLNGYQSFVNISGGVIDMCSNALNLNSVTGGTVSIGNSASSTIMNSPTVSLTGIPSSIKTSMIYYDTTTKAVSYGSAPDVLPLNNSWSGKNTFTKDVSFNNTNTLINSSNIVSISGGIINISGGSVNVNGPTSLNGPITSIGSNTWSGQNIYTSPVNLNATQTFTVGMNTASTAGLMYGVGVNYSRLLIDSSGNVTSDGNGSFKLTNTNGMLVNNGNKVNFEANAGGNYSIGTNTSNGSISFGFGAAVLTSNARLAMDQNGIINTYGSSVFQVNNAGGLKLASFAGGGTTSASIDNNGIIGRTSSDKRLKKDIVSLSVVDKFDSLNPVQYKWIDEEKYGTRTEFGFLANDIQELYPNLVYNSFSDASGNGYLGFSQSSLIPILTSVLQAKSKLIATQSEQLSTQSGKIALLEERMSALESK